MSTQIHINKLLASNERQTPVMTISMLVLVAIVTGLQFIDPQVLETLRRNPTAFRAGEWWRLLTPLLVHADGWLAWLFNSVGLALVGPSVEQQFGRGCWLLLFLVGGVAGNIAGYAWEPYGAGVSVGMFGLVGGLCAWLLLRSEPLHAAPRVYIVYIVTVLCCDALGIVRWNIVVAIVLCSLYVNLFVVRQVGVPRLGAWIVAGLGLFGAAMLVVRHNNHGPPIIAAVCVAALLLQFDPALRTS